MARHRPGKKFLPRLLLVVSALLVSLLALELGLRIYGRLTGGSRDLELSPKALKRKLFPGMLREAKALYPPSDPLFSLVSGREKLAQKNYPSLGMSLRDYDYPAAKPEGLYRIIGLGDSFAWGWGVPDNRRTVFKYLECWLNARAGEDRFEVINCARPAAMTGDYLAFLRENGNRLDADLVLIVFNLNDPYISHASMVVDRRTEQMMREQKDPLSEKSFLYRLIKKRWLRKKVHDFTVGNIRDSYFGPLREERWERAKRDLLAIRDTCREGGEDLVVAVFPLLFELEKRYPFESEAKEVEGFLESSGIKCINLLPAFKGKKTFILWSSPTDSHPNEVAHRLAAEAIFRFLEEVVLTGGEGKAPPMSPAPSRRSTLGGWGIPPALTGMQTRAPRS